jgi:general secretion pathway protein L
MAPGWVRRLMPEPPKTATLIVEDKAWRVVSSDETLPSLELDPSLDDQGLAQQIVQAQPAFSLQRLNVLLPQSSVLRRRLDLPLIPDSDLRSAVELQVDRLSPFKADAVRFGARVLSRDRVEGKLVADIVIAPRAGVEAIEQRLGALGLAPGTIDVAGGNGEPLGFDLRAVEEGVSTRRALLVNAGLVLATVFAWYMVGVAWEASRESEVGGWQARIAELRPQAQRSAALRKQLDGMVQPLAMARGHRPGRTLNIVLELTKLIPDTARLTELRMTGSMIELTGLASDAPGLVPVLEASKLFKDVKFRSPVMRRPEVNKDRFEMSLRLERGASR